MSDRPFEMLMAELASCRRPLLWVVDENFDPLALNSMRDFSGVQALTNRSDVAAQLESAGVEVALSDFDFSAFEPSTYASVLYSVSKEKPVVHHVINAARQLLSRDGELVLAGYKNDGCKTYLDKAARYLGERVALERGGNSAMLGVITANAGDGEPLDDKAYRELRVINPNDAITFESKPGVFGWNKIDQGSAFLCDSLAQVMAPQGDEPKLLDLGCGYGYLSVMAEQAIPGAMITATDNNAAAQIACQRNFERFQIDGIVRLESCGEGLPSGQFDGVICNPPFHQGFGVEGTLTERFLAATHRLLRKGGRGLFVINQFIPLEQKANGLFRKVERIAANRSFSVIMVER